MINIQSGPICSTKLDAWCLHTRPCVRHIRGYAHLRCAHRDARCRLRNGPEALEEWVEETVYRFRKPACGCHGDEHCVVGCVTILGRRHRLGAEEQSVWKHGSISMHTINRMREGGGCWFFFFGGDLPTYRWATAQTRSLTMHLAWCRLRCCYYLVFGYAKGRNTPAVANSVMSPNTHSTVEDRGSRTNSGHKKSLCD